MSDDLAPEVAIFGASTVDVNGNTLICGGMGAHQTIDGQHIYSLSLVGTKPEFSKMKQTPDDASMKPFMIGSAAMYHNDSVIIWGGGATCFSMGTFWDTNIYQAKVPELLDPTPASSANISEVKFISAHRVVSSTTAQKGDTFELGRSDAKARISTIPRVSLSSASDFETILRQGLPVVIEKLDLGVCVDKWTAEYMTESVGANKQVSVLQHAPLSYHIFLTSVSGCDTRMPYWNWQDGFQREKLSICHRRLWNYNDPSKEWRQTVLAISVK